MVVRVASNPLSRGIQGLVATAAIGGVGLVLFSVGGLFPALNQLCYYTLQSNLILAAAFGWAAFRSGEQTKDSPFFAWIKLASVFWVLVTGIVFHLLLAAYWHPTGALAWGSWLLHYVTPTGAFLWWLSFEPKGRVSLWQPVQWLSYPLAYFAFTQLRGPFDGYYPYWFLDPTLPFPKGVGSHLGALSVAGILTLAFLVLGMLLVAIDWATDRTARLFSGRSPAPPSVASDSPSSAAASH